MVNFTEEINIYKNTIDNKLTDCYPEIDGEQSIISQACRYSLLAGGKRIRPILCLATSRMLGVDINKVIEFACAIEMIHTFSLIHDDLPGMDNDDFRRGRKTCHKIYGEAIAILAGDALLNKAYENMIRECIDYPSEGKVKAMYSISKATGEYGMIGGQVIDIQSEDKEISFELLKKLHAMKTGALLKAPVMVALSIAEADEKTKKTLEKYADDIGLAFQIKDDILDVVSTTEEMGKTVGKDAKSKKSTYVTLLGLELANEKLESTIKSAFSQLDKLENYGFNVEFLKELTNYLLIRKN